MDDEDQYDDGYNGDNDYDDNNGDNDYDDNDGQVSDGGNNQGNSGKINDQKSLKDRAQNAKNNVNRVKDNAQRAGKAAKKGAKLAVKAAKAARRAVGLAIKLAKAIIGLAIKFWPVTLVILLVVLLLIIFWMVTEKDQTEEISITIDSYASSNEKATDKFKEQYEVTGSMIYATDDDVEQIAKDFLKEIKTKNKTKYISYMKKYSNGDKDNKITGFAGLKMADVNDKKSFIEHALCTEKYNFNRINWQAYKRSDLVNASEPTGEIEMIADKDIGIRYPKYEGDLGAENEEEFYVNMLTPYLQSWVIPMAMVNGTMDAGTNQSSEEDISNNFGANAYNTKFGYQIISKGYHQIDFDRYELYTRSFEESYKLYDEKISDGTVTRTCTTYTRYIDASGVTVPAGTEGAVPESQTACSDGAISMGQATSTRYVEFPKNLRSDYYNIKQYFIANHADENAVERESTGGITATDKGNETIYQYDVTKYYGFDYFFEKEYKFTAYDITAVEDMSNEFKSDNIEESTIYLKGTKTVYAQKQDTAPSWISEEGVTSTTNTSTINVQQIAKEGQVTQVARTWNDQLILDSDESGQYDSEFLSGYISEKDLSNMEKGYYLKLDNDELDAINMVDLINSEPTIYKKYLGPLREYSKYIGYSRDYLAVSYYILRDYLEEISKDGLYTLMWGNSILPGITIGAAGTAIAGEALAVPAGTNVIYPYSKEAIESDRLWENTTYISTDVYGYAGHTGFDIIDNGAVASPTNACPDSIYGNTRNCPFMKGAPIYAVMTGKITGVSYSECHLNFDKTKSYGNCSDSTLKYIDRTKKNPNLNTDKKASSVTMECVYGGTTYKVVYWHLYPDFEQLNYMASLVGTTINIGTFIGYTGNTGCSTDPHLHFEVGKQLFNGNKNGGRTYAILKQGKNNTLSKGINDIVVNPDDVTATNQPTYNGKLSEKFYYYLGVGLEGMDITSNNYFVAENIGDGTITVGPGVTNVGETTLAKKMGYSDYFPMKVGDHVPKSVVLDLFYTSIDQQYAADVEKKAAAAGVTLKQNQFEALVLTCYQRGVNSDTYKSLFAKIKNNSSDIQSTWEYVNQSSKYYSGLTKRRKAEYKLFSQGIYTPAYDGGTYVFSTATPFTDAAVGKNTVTRK